VEEILDGFFPACRSAGYLTDLRPVFRPIQPEGYRIVCLYF
jgi:hypothetical protein